MCVCAFVLSHDVLYGVSYDVLYVMFLKFCNLIADMFY